MSSAYPTLLSLGVNRPHEISSYTLSSTNDFDILRIRYIRKKGSLLPVSKKFKFPRRPIFDANSQPGQPIMSEISPALEDALEELSQLLSKDIELKDRKSILLQELEDFEEYISLQIAEFKAEINKFEAE